MKVKRDFDLKKPCIFGIVKVGDPKKVGRVALSKQNMDESYEGTPGTCLVAGTRRCFGLGLNLEEDIAFLRTRLSPSRKWQHGLNYMPYTLRKYHQYWHWMVCIV